MDPTDEPHDADAQQQGDGPNPPPPPPQYIERVSTVTTMPEANAPQAYAVLPHMQPQNYNLTMMFVSDMHVQTLNNCLWEVRVDICANDIPTLMRRGLYWSSRNVTEGGSFFLTQQHELPPFARVEISGWSTARRFALVDHAENPQWTADVWLFARHVWVLHQFSLDELLFSQIHSVTAVNRYGLKLYTYVARDPGQNCNVITGHMPLKGWWPWPKREDEQPSAEFESDHLDVTEE